jgi:hypothetical protein
MHKLSRVLCLLLIGCWYHAPAQEKFFTKTGKITFLSNAPLENIEAVNKTAGAVLDTKTGAVQAVVLMRGFEFKKALMQEHFNENYVESHKYPSAELRGSILNHEEVDYAKDDTYPVTVKGQLSFHGITKEVTLPVTLKIQGGKIEASSVFTVLLSDYRISIPALVKDNINNQVKVTASFTLDPLKR